MSRHTTKPARHHKAAAHCTDALLQPAAWVLLGALRHSRVPQKSMGMLGLDMQCRAFNQQTQPSHEGLGERGHTEGQYTEGLAYHHAKEPYSHTHTWNPMHIIPSITPSMHLGKAGKGKEEEERRRRRRKRGQFSLAQELDQGWPRPQQPHRLLCPSRCVSRILQRQACRGGGKAPPQTTAVPCVKYHVSLSCKWWCDVKAGTYRTCALLFGRACSSSNKVPRAVLRRRLRRKHIRTHTRAQTHTHSLFWHMRARLQPGVNARLPASTNIAKGVCGYMCKETI